MVGHHGDQPELRVAGSLQTPVDKANRFFPVHGARLLTFLFDPAESVAKLPPPGLAGADYSLTNNFQKFNIQKCFFTM